MADESGLGKRFSMIGLILANPPPNVAEIMSYPLRDVKQKKEKNKKKKVRQETKGKNNGGEEFQKSSDVLITDEEWKSMLIKSRATLSTYFVRGNVCFYM